MAAVEEALDATPIVTVTGVGGVGKTALAVAAAAQRDEDRKYFVDLNPLSDPSLVAVTVELAVGIEEGRGGDPLGTLVEGLRYQAALLVLDNCEHVLEAVQALVSQVVAYCPGIRILATSRQPLRVTGERIVGLTGLPARGPAAELFLERAAAARGGQPLSVDARPAVAELCERLDGLPLAIELAAARMNVLGTSDLLDRLDRRLDLLAKPGGDVARHQTLRSVFDWSYELLDPAEQLLFRRLGPFAGGFTLDAAEAVCVGAAIDPLHVPDLLNRLTEKSLLVLEHRGGRARFRRLETVRSYAEDRLRDSEDEQTVRRRHAGWFLDLARKAAAEGTSELANLEMERDNLRSALAWSAEHDPGLALELVVALRPFWEAGGHVAEGRRWTEQAIERGTVDAGALLADALEGLGWLLMRQGDYPAASDRLTRCLSLVGDRLQQKGRVQTALGIVARLEGHFPEAETTLSAALATYTAIGDQRGMAAVMSELGQLAALRSEREASRLLLREALGLARRAGDERRAARVLVLTGEQASRDGDLVTARSFYDAAADAYERTGDRRGMASVYTALGKLAQLDDHLDRSREQHERALDIFQDLSDPRGAALAYSNLGFVAYLMGDHERAEDCFKQSVGLRRQLGDRRGLAIALVGLANAWFLRDDPDPAGAYRLCEEALAIQREIGDDQNAGWTTYIMAEVARDLGEFEAAADHAGACIELFRRAGFDRLAGVGYFSLAALYRHTGRAADGVAFALEALERSAALGGSLQIVRCVELGSSLCCALERFEAGAELNGAAEAGRLRAGLRPKTRTPERRLLAQEMDAMRTALGEAGFEAASRRGAGWTLEEAVEATRRHLLSLGPTALAVASAGSQEYTVNVLGRFEVFPGPGRQAPPGVATQVVKVLAANGSMHLDQLVEVLWPDAPPGVGRRRMHNVLSRLRKVYGDLVVRSGQTLSLNLGVNLDSAAFESTARSALALADSGGPAGLLLRKALELYRGELLPEDRFEEWAVLPRERLRQLALRCMSAAAHLAESEDDVASAIGWLEGAIELSPLDESPYIEAARLLIRAGRRGRAHEMIARARRVAEDLGVPPSPDLAALEGELLS